MISWSPDDRYVIICGTEESTELWIWDVENKVLKKRSHDDSLTSAAWLPDGQTFVTGGIKGHFYNCVSVFIHFIRRHPFKFPGY